VHGSDLNEWLVGIKEACFGIYYYFDGVMLKSGVSALALKPPSVDNPVQ